MKKILLFFLLSVSGAYAQVGIGTETPNTNAMLDISSTTKGLLLPRVALSNSTSASPMTAFVQGMTVYNTATTGDVIPGPYYCDGTKWISVAVTYTESDPQVTSAVTNSIPKWNGTALTDGTIYDNGNIGIGTTSPAYKLDVQGTSTTLNVESTSAAAYHNLSSFSNTEAGFALRTYNSGTSKTRWLFGKTQTGEGGSDTGADFFISRYSDAGNYLSQPFRITRSNGYVGINTAVPATPLEVTGTAKATTLQMTNGAMAGYILKSDSSGLASWVNPTTLANGNWTTSGSNQYSALSGNVGIGITTPVEKLQVDGGIFVNSGTMGTANLTVSGAGARMFFYPAKAAFRAGNVTGTNWNDANIGNYSVAMGSNPKATGNYAVSMGEETEATGNTSTAFGYFSKATGYKSFAVGEFPTASGETSVALGYFTTASGPKSFAMGEFAAASGNVGFATGSFTTASGNYSMASNQGTTAYSYGESAFGTYNTSYTPASTTFWSVTDRLFTVGNGENNASKSDALTILKSGNIGIGTSTPANKLEVSGTTKTTSLQVTSGAANNYVLRSDLSGNASWVNPTTLANGNWTTSGSNQYSALSGNVGIGVTSPSNKLEVSGTTKTTNLQLTNGAAANYVLKSDLSGNASWVNPTTLANGNWTTSGSNQYSALSGNVGIGVTSPDNKLDVQSTTSVTINSQSSAAAAYVAIGSPSASESAVALKTYSGGSVSTRWQLGKSNGPESGSNFGSDFFINRYSDSGTYLNQPFTISRSSGYVGINGYASYPLDVSGDINNTGTYRLSGNTVLSTSGTNNVFVGVNAGKVNTGADNTYLGYNAGAANTSGFDNTAVGSGALAANTSGGANLAIGKNALTANTTGSINIAVGRSTLKANTTGNFNIAMGDAAMLRNTTGTANQGMGYGALQSNLTGAGNVAIGFTALNSVTAADDNVALGNDAGYSATGSSNTFIGNSAGYSVTGSNNICIGNEAGYNATGSNHLYIDVSNTSSPLIYGDFSTDVVTINGSLGIGTTNPTKAKMEISTSIPYPTSGTGYGYFNSGGNSGNGTTTSTTPFSLYATGRIGAAEFNAFSDERIKNIKGVSDSKKDLNTLMDIRITDYTLKDTIAKGTKPYKKVIAQQIEKVYPQAVTLIADAIPDIYKLAAVSSGVFTINKHGLKRGDKVKIITGSNEEMVVITHVTTDTFTTDKSFADGKVFVYGREVDDFHTVDYEALSMLNISATQEIVKQLNDQALQIQVLKADNTSMKADIQDLKAAVFNTVAKGN